MSQTKHHGLVAACGGVFALLMATQSHAQTATVSTAVMGNVASASSGVTILRFSPAAGAVSVQSGSGARVSAGAVRFPVSIACTGAACDKKNTIVTVGSTGTPTGRAGSLTNFTVAMGTATLVTAASGTNPITFTIGQIGTGNAATFYIGADLPISGDDSAALTGTAGASIYVTTADDKGHNPITSGGALTANVFRKISISQTAALAFGRLVRPTLGSGDVTLTASTGTFAITAGVALSSPAPVRGAFSITGEGGQTIAVSVPTTVTMTNGQGGSINVTTSNTAQGTQLLSNAVGSQGTFGFYVGGTFPITATTPSGAYSGTYAINVSYN
jgi:hypothetical protein